jgi:hypothetical protein
VRLWSLHPKNLDRQGLLACWREALLAQKVLQGETKGYLNHPQLIRFRASADPLAAIAAYLSGLVDEADSRGYSFDRSKIASTPTVNRLPVTRGQVLYEWDHLLEKLRRRDPSRWEQVRGIDLPEVHPLFQMIEGEMENWEKPKSPD